ncbi:MAG: glycogen/starch/alpha-glucan phosphorylase [Deltaproteobacteria bacterium]|nr:glycogen/starch/alpha-glucan phosphorylase [Deltaproteobacteria bacterium]
MKKTPTIPDKPDDPLAALFNPKDCQGIKKTILNHLLSFQGRDPERAGQEDIYKALAYTMRDFMVEKWISTQKGYYTNNKKRVYYLSMEFLIGRSLGNSLINMGFWDRVEKVMDEMGFDLEEILDKEEDAALGNGGLGRLAACFMDSIATMKIPAYGYGINYEYGLFNQKIVNGYQVESPDNWLRFGTAWEFTRRMPIYPIKFYGRVNSTIDENGNYRSEWVDAESVMAVACDVLIPGYMNDNVINMRLWQAKASRDLDLSYFDRGDYIGAVHNKVRSETISKLLYPPDEACAGHELRLKQQYFFVAATFQDIFRRFTKHNKDFSKFSDQVAVQLNDTHPAIAIPELMRILLDDHGLGWEKAWNICGKTFAYTNHTLMPEALETWAVDLLGRVLPRHLEIIYEINQRFLDTVSAKYPGDGEKLRNMSIIGDGPPKQVRMANLAIVGSHSVNGVAALHSELLKSRLFKDFDAFRPNLFNNKTNGITPRRWLLKCNPSLASLISAQIGDSWITDLSQLHGLSKLAHNAAFQKKFRAAKKHNKLRLTKYIREFCHVKINPDSMFDVQVKRIHEYKRQLLNVLHIIALYHRLVADPKIDIPPRTFIFAGKAAPSYWKAKLIIKLINSVAEVVNNDPRLEERLKVIFIPNYGVSLAEKIIPAADLSEQISTAGTEASGTSNMKFALNGALTIGTLDGANIEIMEEAGNDNIFIFGLTAKEAEWEKRSPHRTPRMIYEQNQEIRQIIDAMMKGSFSNGDTNLFKPIVDDLLEHHRDPYLHLIDLEDYMRCQNEVSRTYRDNKSWTAKAILNVANMGKFSSDRTIKEYAQDIWGI